MYRTYITKRKVRENINRIVDTVFIYFGVGILITLLLVMSPLIILDYYLSGDHHG